MVMQAEKLELPMRNGALGRPLCGCIVGAGRGFIGNVHMASVRLDNMGIWVAGVPDEDPEIGKRLWNALWIPEKRCYGTMAEMLEAEAARMPLSLAQMERCSDRFLTAFQLPLDWISICTPNFAHFEAAKKAILAGFNVMCEKPMVLTVEQAAELVELVNERRVVFGVAHTYTGHPMITLARELIEQGVIGEVEQGFGWYLQGWLRTLLEREKQQQAEWRTDRARAGRGGALGDILVHAAQMMTWLTGTSALQVNARLRTAVEGRKTDDQAFAEILGKSGKRGAPDVYFSLSALQTASGEQNNFGWRLCGTKGTLIWEQERPQMLTLRRNGEADLVYRRDPNASWASEAFKAACSLPSGHGEEYHRAKANVYARFFADVIRRMNPQAVFGTDYGSVRAEYPNVYDGFLGVAVINAAADSDEAGGGWVDIAQAPGWPTQD